MLSRHDARPICSDEILKAVRWGSLIASYGGHVAVIGPDNVDRASFDFAASRDAIITTLNDIGMVMTGAGIKAALHPHRSEEHTSELQSLMRTSYAAFCLKIKQTSQIKRH